MCARQFTLTQKKENDTVGDENLVILRGHLTRDPELKTIPSGKSVCNFNLAVNAGGRGKKAMFIECVAWERVAETIADVLSKGDPLYVRGFLMLETWQGKQGKMSRHKVSVQLFHFPGGSRDSRNYDESGEFGEEGEDIDDSEIPF